MTDSLGTGLYLSGSVLFFVRGIGLSAAEVGLGLTLAGLAGLAATVPLGILGDRLGVKRVLMALQAWRAVMLVALTFVTGFGGFLAAAVGLSIAASSVSPATQAVVSAVMTGEERVSTMAIMRSVRNVGYSVGALATVPVFAMHSLWAYRSLFLANAATFLASVLLLVSLRVAAGAAKAATARRGYPSGIRDWRFLNLAMLNGFFSLHISILSIAIPLWVLATGAPQWTVSIVFVLNTALAVLLQIAAARGSNEPGFGGRALRRAAGALVVCCLLFAAAPLGDRVVVFAALVLGAVALTAGELWQSAGGWALSFECSPEARRAEYLGAFNLGPVAQNILGPLLMTAIVAHREYGWLFLAALFGLGALLIEPAVAAVERHQARIAAAEEQELAEQLTDQRDRGDLQTAETVSTSTEP
ncbi:MAG TPA: MFS transporter [Actinocrinis sp.]|nr:MFS transporter [Actinocrinis sp.]